MAKVGRGHSDAGAAVPAGRLPRGAQRGNAVLTPRSAAVPEASGGLPALAGHYFADLGSVAPMRMKPRGSEIKPVGALFPSAPGLVD